MIWTTLLIISFFGFFGFLVYDGRDPVDSLVVSFVLMFCLGIIGSIVLDAIGESHYERSRERVWEFFHGKIPQKKSDPSTFLVILVVFAVIFFLVLLLGKPPVDIPFGDEVIPYDPWYP